MLIEHGRRRNTVHNSTNFNKYSKTGIFRRKIRLTKANGTKLINTDGNFFCYFNGIIGHVIHFSV